MKHWQNLSVHKFCVMRDGGLMDIPRLILAALMLASTTSYGAAEMCTLEKLKSVAANSPECYFYSGTTRFRDGNYSEAAASWTKLIKLQSVSVDLEHLKTSAYNNLGFLYFTGKGLTKDKKLAIKYWNYATEAGNEEAGYHLCHAYADKREPTYNPKTALGYCKEALRRYSQLQNSNEDNSEIVRQINSYLSRLENK